MICSGLAMCAGLPYGVRSHGSLVPGRCRFDTENPVRPALGREPRPVAPSSRISPPAPVEAPGNGEMAVGWLCVSTFISTWAVSRRAWYGDGPVAAGTQRSIGPPSITEALSLYATTVC